MRVDVGFEGAEGRWGSRFEECDGVLVLRGMSPICDCCRAKEKCDCTCGSICRKGVNIVVTEREPHIADKQATNTSLTPHYHLQRL